MDNQTQIGWRRSPLIALLVALLVVSACSGDEGSDSSDSASTGSTADSTDESTDETADKAPDTSSEASSSQEQRVATERELVLDYSPEMVEGPCPFAEPTGTSPLCGTVTVPADWTDPDGGPTIEMPFAIFPGPAEAEGGRPDPVVYLEGGPGGHTLETVPFSFDLLFRPLTGHRDVILFDQRGAGGSRPQLGCSETGDVGRFLADNPDTSDDQTLNLMLEAAADCKERLGGEGVDLNHYDTVQNARDVEALRVALGYDQWNLFGISYGTRLGLEMLHRFPDTVRSAVLDSVFPPNVDAVAENPATFVDSFLAVSAACAAEPACAGSGDLLQRVQALVARLEANPLPAAVTNWVTGEVDDVFIDGDMLEGVVVLALYSPSSFTDLPEVVTGLEAGDVAAAELFLSQNRTNEAFFSDGMFYAMICRDEVAFADRAKVDAAVPESPFRPGQPFDVALNAGPAAFELCAALDLGGATDATTGAVVSDVPTLLLAGGFDPVTPVSWAELALETLSSGHLVVAPNQSHAVSANSCGRSLVVAFIDDPTGSPDASCLDDDHLRFLSPPTDPIELAVTVRTNSGGGPSFQVVEPVDWEPGGVDGLLLRSASTLDQAQLYQLAESPAFVPAIANFVEESQGVELGPPMPFGPGDQLGSLDGAELDFGWSRRSAVTDDVVIEWFQVPLDSSIVVIGLIAPIEEADRLTEDVLVPALRGFAVEPG